MNLPEHLLNAKLCNKDTCEEIRTLKKENNDLRKIYRNTYKHLFEIGSEELARYFMAQIDDCPTFYVEPIVDYYEENQRLNNVLNELEGDLCAIYNSFETTNNDILKKHLKKDIYLCRFKELKESDK